MELTKTLPRKALIQKVRDIKTAQLGAGSQPAESLEPLTLIIKISPQNLEKFNRAKQQLQKKLHRSVTNEEVFLANLPDQQPIPAEAPRPNNKTLTPKHKKYLSYLYRGICSHPNCHKAIQEFHHPSYQAIQPHKHDNVVPFCKEHHQIAHLSTRSIDKKVQSYWK